MKPAMRNWPACIFALTALTLSLPISASASAQVTAPAVVTSGGPASVSVSLYRNPERDAAEPLQLDDLQGFALISETRIVDLPPGRVVIRFEGVASGIQPESAIVLGAPVAEKNRDRALLSQRGLLDAFTGQQVIIKRTNAQTGAVTNETGTIRSGGDRVVLQTKDGFEALYCNYQNETLLFPGVPAGLSAKPTLSVTTADQPGGKQTITLTYLAGNFDWQANYVAQLSDDAKSVDLLAWLTMASADDTSFVNADAFAIAGKIERQARDGAADENGPYSADNIEVFFSCWPYGNTTSGLGNGGPPPPPEFLTFAPPPPPAMVMRMAVMADSDIIVTAQKRVAEQEDLGDLKLYRIPFPVTVAARAQKQVAFLNKPSVAGEMVYQTEVNADYNSDIAMLYRVQNKKSDGLGEALPAGKIAFFQSADSPSGPRRMLVGESTVDDKAVGEEVEFPLSGASNVSAAIEETARSKKSASFALTVKNANPHAVTFEAEFSADSGIRHNKFSGKMLRKKGKDIWRTTIPANDEATLSYRVGALSGE